MRISIFPLVGAVLYPGTQLPLHVFESRYRALISDALARDRRIGMIQPHIPSRPPTGRMETVAPLFPVGCLGRIGRVEALDDGRYNIVLEGEARFRILSELTVSTPFRQIEAELLPEDNSALSIAERASFEHEARQYAHTQGYHVDWDAVARLDDQMLINAVSQIAPFDAASKQALLEADSLSERCALLVQLMRFFGRYDHDEGHATLQ